MKILFLIVLLVNVANAQTPETRGSSWPNVDKGPELNTDILKSIPLNDIQGRIRVMQEMVNKSRAWVRRHQAAGSPAPSVGSEIPAPAGK